MLLDKLPDNTSHDLIRAVVLLQDSGYIVSRRPIKKSRPSDEYDPQKDALGSYNHAIAALRVRHRDVVAGLMPKLRVARGNRRISTKRFAPRLGVSDRYLRRCEAGKEVPSPALFSRWRDILGL